ncbi:MAG: SdpI family protein [Syntrophomonadaceae bacterium]|nr:SdpI family protein [Syntrophomonadaceae bacterium]
MTGNNSKLYRVDWETLRRDWMLWLIMAGMILFAIWIYPRLPAMVPGHWNLQGEIDRYYPKSFGAFFAPVLTVGIYLMMLFLPLIDPRRDNYERFAGAYTFLRWGLVIFFAIIYGISILAALGHDLDVALLIKGLVAVLFVVIGNFMGQFRHNYFVGIKTPWTLANEEVWRRTHRLAGRIWVVCGLVGLAVSPIESPWGAGVFFAALMIAAVVPILYSYVIFADLQKR